MVFFLQVLSVAPGLNEFHMARAGTLKVRQTGSRSIIFNFLSIEHFFGPCRVILLSVDVIPPFLLKHFCLILSFVLVCSFRLTFTVILLSSLCASVAVILVDGCNMLLYCFNAGVRASVRFMLWKT